MTAPRLAALRGALGRRGGAWMTPVRPFWQMNMTARAAA